jgi:SAM-dependent methyltransferase
MYSADYFSHDAEYQRRRALGNPGWETAGALAEYLALLEQVFDAPCFPKEGKLLELGCGAGDLSLWAAERGYEACGVDISPTAIQWAVEKAGQRGVSADFQTGDVLDLSRYASDWFDIVLDGRCFHCIVGEDRMQFLREAFRVLRPGGVFHVETMCGDPGCEEYRRQFDEESRSLIRNGRAYRHLGLADGIEREIATAGFTVISRWIIPRRNDRELDLLVMDATKG